MNTIVPKDNLIDDLQLHKYVAINKMSQALDVVDKYESKMIKTASSGSTEVDSSALVSLFTQMLATLNVQANGDLKDIVSKISDASGNIEKEATIKKDSKERKDDIKIVSKNIKDSHYQIDVSKDIIKQDGKEMLMVSCYARDAYLGRYLIKRNYFYTADRDKFADNAYDEIMTKVGALKDRYYNEIINVSGIFTQLKQILDGVVSEMEMKEDSLGTSVNR